MYDRKLHCTFVDTLFVVVLVVVPNICTERIESSQPWFPVIQGRVCSAFATMHVNFPLDPDVFTLCNSFPAGRKER